MLKKIAYFFSFLFLCLSMPVVAGVIQCPGSSNFVNTGDTIEQVIKECGPPIKKGAQKKEAAVWVYSLMSFAGNHIGFSVLFEEDRVSGLMTTQKIGKTAITCPYGRIHMGSTPAQVVAACGQPTEIRNVSKSYEKTTGQITYLIYQPRSYLPKTKLIFQDGRLLDSD